MLRVIESGILTAVRDAGRTGHRHIGIAGEGPIDPLHFELANLLVGNNGDEAAIEIVAGTFCIRAEDSSQLAPVGQGFEVIWQGEHNAKKLPLNWQINLKTGDSLTIKQRRPGAVCYLALKGGVAAERFLESYTTDLRLGRGGLEGRPLAKGDLVKKRIVKHERQKDRHQQALLGRGINTPINDFILRATNGPEHDDLTTDVSERFWSSHWQVSRNSDRMGARLSISSTENRATISTSLANNLRSHAVMTGTVQLTSTTEAILLGPGCQTTGGYHRVAQVIRSDLWKVAQAAPGQKLRFKKVTREQALKALTKQRQALYKSSLAKHYPSQPI